MNKPTPRGPVSATLLEALSGPVRSLPELEPLAEGVGAPSSLLEDDDFQLALFCLYELHYGGVDGVDERWEWHPDLIAFRSTLEIAKAANIPECTRLTRTIRRWEDEVLAYSTNDGLSNARTEAVNGLMKKVKRGHGFRNLENYRLRLLLHCGGVTWQDQPAAKPRKRTPHLVA